MRLRSRHLALVAFLATAALVAGCGGDGDTPSTTPSTPGPAPTQAELTVDVIDGDTRAPLAGATVRAIDEQSGQVTAELVAGANGQAAVPAGTTLAQATGPGHQADARAIPAGKTGVTIPLYDPTLQSPEYGGGGGRTRYVPSVDLPPPSGRPTWDWTGRALLEFPPAVARGVVALTTNTGRVLVFNARTGFIIWTKRQSTTIPIASSPAIIAEQGMVLVSGMDGRLVAYTLANGRELWTFSTGRSKIESSPLVSEGTAYIGAHNGRLYAVATDTGKARWTFQAAGDIKSSVAKSGDTIVVGDYAGTLYGVSASTGTQIWRARVGKRLYGGPAISGNTVVVGDVGGAVVAVDLRTGRQRWRHPTNGGIVYSSPAIARGSVFIGSYNGTFEALGLSDGKRRWAYDVGGRISGSATVVGTTVYTSVLARKGERDRTFGLDVATGKVVWQNDDGRYSPAVGAGRTLYIVGKNTLYAYRTD